MLERTSCSVFIACVLTGCAAHKNELLFGESTDVGITLRPNATTDFEFTFGYKARDIAVVPVVGVDKSGVVQRRAKDGEDVEDAVSVFGQFNVNCSSVADKAKCGEKVSLGRFFATGRAATNLARGYRDGWIEKVGPEAVKAQEARDAEKQSAAAKRAEEAEKKAAAKKAEEAKKSAEHNTVEGTRGPATVSVATAVSTATATATEILPALVFGQSDTFGLNVGVSAADKGADFTLGYSGRNIAIMPVFAEDGLGKFQGVGSANAHGAVDSFSVIGQFKADTAGTAKSIDLDRFFATGLAAQELSSGLQIKISNEIKK
jgi:hypothetical protein